MAETGTTNRVLPSKKFKFKLAKDVLIPAILKANPRFKKEWFVDFKIKVIDIYTYRLLLKDNTVYKWKPIKTPIDFIIQPVEISTLLRDVLELHENLYYTDQLNSLNDYFPPEITHEYNSDDDSIRAQHNQTYLDKEFTLDNTSATSSAIFVTRDTFIIPL